MPVAAVFIDTIGGALEETSWSLRKGGTVVSIDRVTVFDIERITVIINWITVGNIERDAETNIDTVVKRLGRSRMCIQYCSDYDSHYRSDYGT